MMPPLLQSQHSTEGIFTELLTTALLTHDIHVHLWNAVAWHRLEHVQDGHMTQGHSCAHTYMLSCTSLSYIPSFTEVYSQRSLRYIPNTQKSTFAELLSKALLTHDAHVHLWNAVTWHRLEHVQDGHMSQEHSCAHTCMLSCTSLSYTLSSNECLFTKLSPLQSQHSTEGIFTKLLLNGTTNSWYTCTLVERCDLTPSRSVFKMGICHRGTVVRTRACFRAFHSVTLYPSERFIHGASTSRY